MHVVPREVRDLTMLSISVYSIEAVCFGIFNIFFSPAKSKQIALSLIYNIFCENSMVIYMHMFLFLHIVG